jgi:hypothetical protein
MEISPIPGIRSLPVMKTPRADADLSQVFEIVNSTRPDDDTYDGSSKKDPGGQDDESQATEDPEGIEELQAIAEAPSTQTVEETGQTPEDPGLGVNYFA